MPCTTSPAGSKAFRRYLCTVCSKQHLVSVQS